MIVVRKVRTGKRGKTEFAKLEYSLFQRAAAQHFGARAIVEAVHPSDRGVEDVPLPQAKKAGNNDTAVEKILAGIAAGLFPPDPDSFRCPRCPHFFICASVPEGPLAIA